ncbi:UvrD-helicase domain-containing protein [Allonocardiopsis opalescens]|uniref:DNA 3'-5' helicase n=1 Tax=Allonocardiopsis opalescens TaxID=1144618 RepID=A0A2T0PX41_9ACTN|nr:UvrD-helicase domain-containing protein [Allonocardiopsis opalescens]PRX96110.1 uncharacterized protein (TIGR00375 family) [Allonocardiopsis opalescens]
MSFYADLHIHSKYSRACSRDCDLEHLSWWAGRKGVAVVGTGDFTHPVWGAELREKLVPAEPGLFRLRPEAEREIARTLPAACRTPVRFMLSVEISTIYKRGDRTRKVHHLLYAPTMDAAEHITRALGRIGNIASDGRPILGLDSRDLLEITLESDPGSYLVPAHIWTPWFSALGSKSGFDAIADCYADLADRVFAVETGLSSDPEMNWTVSSLDGYTLVSNSDAHSPPMLAREASAFDTGFDYYEMRRALETGEGYAGSVEFFPEEGKYHLDGHRKCDVRLDPDETRALGGRCPQCGRPLTVGVLSRVVELADREPGRRPPGRAGFRSFVPLPEIMGEILGVGPKSKKVLGAVAELVAKLGPELAILGSVPVDDVRAAGGELLGEAIARLRRGEVVRDSGYDGEYGVIRLFQPEELRTPASAPTLFDTEEVAPARPAKASGRGRPERRAAAPPADDDLFGGAAEAGPDAEPELFPLADAPAAPSRSILEGLDAEQRAAAAHPGGPLLIVAGPGTGKTRTLTHRIAHLVTERGVPAEHCLAITFTNRAREELAERLAALAPAQAPAVTVATFHGLGARILRERHGAAGLPADWRIADDAERLAAAAETAGTERLGRRLLADADRPEPDPDAAEAAERYRKALRARGLVDFADLLRLPVRLLADDPALLAHYRERWRWISVDEYQDVDEQQYTLLCLLAGADGNITAIGDPDQAIYRFRGADVGYFLRFGTDFSGAASVQLGRNYRSSATIVDAAVAAVAPSSLVPDRTLRAVGSFSDPARIGVHAAAGPEAEAEFVARTVDRLLGGISHHSLDSGRVAHDGADGLGFADIAVLYRTDGQAGALMTAFNRAGIPFQKRSHDRLLARPGMRLLADELPHQPAGPLPERLRLAAAAVCDRLGDRADQATDVRTAAELLRPLAESHGEDLPALLAALAVGAEVDALDPRADRVALLTLHASKGLEYPVVFLVGCEDGLLPHRLPGAGPDPAAEAEERRLFFVGMTRAKERLYLSHARERARHGATARPARPSPFLADVPAALTMPVDAETATRRRPKDRQLRLM